VPPACNLAGEPRLPAHSAAAIAAIADVQAPNAFVSADRGTLCPRLSADRPKPEGCRAGARQDHARRRYEPLPLSARPHPPRSGGGRAGAGPRGVALERAL